jgi:tetratricopeptide (TPR) repeat protein
MKIRPLLLLLVLSLIRPQLFPQNKEGGPSAAPKNVQDDKSGQPAMKLYDVPSALEAETPPPAEAVDYLNISQAKDPGERAKLIEEFLKKYPESKYAPTLHQAATSLYQQLNNRDKMIEHGEKTLLSTPNNAVILSLLALAYTSGGEPDKAIDRASKAVSAIEKLTVPANSDEARWKAERDQYLAMNYASMGSSYLAKYEFERKAQQESKAAVQAQGGSTGTTDGSSKKEVAAKVKEPSGENPSSDSTNLTQAHQCLTKAVELNPQYDYAEFQLGVVYAYQNQSSKAMDLFAKTVVLEGSFKDMARRNLEAIYKLTHKNSLDGVEQLLSKAKEDLAPKKAEVTADPQ